MGLFDIFRGKKRTATPNPDAEKGDWMKWFLNREGLAGKFNADPGGYVDYAPWISFNDGGYAQSGPKRRQKLQPRSMQANINSFNNQIRRDPDSIYRTRSPAGNQYETRRFNVVDSNTTHGMRYKGGSNQEDILKSGYFSNSYFTNPTTGNKMGNSMATFQGPDREWGEARHIYPDASGFGETWDSEGNESYYPIQLVGPQTWNYDPGSLGIMGLIEWYNKFGGI